MPAQYSGSLLAEPCVTQQVDLKEELNLLDAPCGTLAGHDLPRTVHLCFPLPESSRVLVSTISG